MKSTIKLLALSLLLTSIVYSVNVSTSEATSKTGSDAYICDAYMYVANNSLFEINVYIDNVGVGNVLTGKSKTFTYTLSSDTPKKVKTKCTYQDPDYIDPKSVMYVTKTKVECGQSDTVYFGFQK
jgi:hypothetical protein